MCVCDVQNVLIIVLWLYIYVVFVSALQKKTKTTPKQQSALSGSSPISDFLTGTDTPVLTPFTGAKVPKWRLGSSFCPAPVTPGRCLHQPPISVKSLIFIKHGHSKTHYALLLLYRALALVDLKALCKGTVFWWK